MDSRPEGEMAAESAAVEVDLGRAWEYRGIVVGGL
jgi:hypothetical protein